MSVAVRGSCGSNANAAIASASTMSGRMAAMMSASRTANRMDSMRAIEEIRRASSSRWPCRYSHTRANSVRAVSLSAMSMVLRTALSVMVVFAMMSSFLSVPGACRTGHVSDAGAAWRQTRVAVGGARTRRVPVADTEGLRHGRRRR